VIGFLFLVGLNAVDAWLIGRALNVTGFSVNPLVPPISANITARCLIAAAMALLLFLLEKRSWLLWLNVVSMLLVGWHAAGLIIKPFNLAFLQSSVAR
jgi:hypothetical protein